MIPALLTKRTVLLASATQSAAATRSANIDTLGCDYVEIAVNLGIEVNTNGIGPAITISEGDTTSSVATWSSDFVRAAESLATAHQVIFKIDTRARKRYLNLSILSETTTNDHVTAGADVILSRRDASPAGTAGLIGSTNDVVVVG